MFEPRLPPLAPAQLDVEQRQFHDASLRSIEARFQGFETRVANGGLIGPWSVWIRDPSVGQAAEALVAAIAALDELPKRTREIVILTMGARYKAAYELYAHSALARQAGLEDRQIAALCVGRKPEGLAEDEELAFDCASFLASGGVLPGFLYLAAESTFGTKGLAQLVYLAGVYAFVSILLNAHDVPAPLSDGR